jgi:hypothetical protein
MHMLERVLTNTVNAGIMGMVPATVGAAEQESRYQSELDRQEEQFRQEQARARRRRMIHLGCE